MFTFRDMENAFTEHGNALVWVDEHGDENSANPADYWYRTGAETCDGDLAVYVPATLRIITPEPC